MVWNKKTDERGQVYYHNSITGQSQREEPSIFRTLRASLSVGHASSPLQIPSPSNSPHSSLKEIRSIKDQSPQASPRSSDRVSRTGSVRPTSAVREARIKEAQLKSPKGTPRGSETDKSRFPVTNRSPKQSSKLCPPPPPLNLTPAVDEAVTRIQSIVRGRQGRRSMQKLRVEYERTLRLVKLRLQHHLLRYYSRHDNEQDRAQLFFQEYDIDSSGAIDVSELSIMAAYLGCELNYREQQLFAISILRHLGDMYEVSESEFLIWYSRECGARVDDSFRQVIREYLLRFWKALPFKEKMHLAFEEHDVERRQQLSLVSLQHLISELGVSSRHLLGACQSELTTCTWEQCLALPWDEHSELSDLDERQQRYLSRGTSMLELQQIYTSLDEHDPARLTQANLLRLSEVLKIDMTESDAKAAHREVVAGEGGRMSIHEVMLWWTKNTTKVQTSARTLMSTGESDKVLRIRLKERFVSTAVPENSTNIAGRLSDGKLVHVSLIVRHGARGPNKSEMRPFAGPVAEGDQESKSATALQWKPEELEILTATGEKQLRAVARWFSFVYLGAEHPELVGESVSNAPSVEAAKAAALAEVQSTNEQPGQRMKRIVKLGSNRSVAEGPPAHVTAVSSEAESVLDDLACMGITIQHGTPTDSSSLERKLTGRGRGGRGGRGRGRGRGLSKQKTVRHIIHKSKFRSSIVSRTMESSRCFFDVFRHHVIAFRCTPDTHDSDETFRGYKLDQVYKRHVKNDKNSSPYVHKAMEHIDFLKHVTSTLGVLRPSDQPQDLLYNTTYFLQMLECEAAWPPEKGTRRCLANSLSFEERDKLADLGTWVWDRRFFNAFSERIGGRLLREIFHDAVSAPLATWRPPSTRNLHAVFHDGAATSLQEKERQFNLAIEDNVHKGVSVYVAHDYTVLALLSALGVPRYLKEHKLGFACHLLLETYEAKGSGRRYMKVVLNHKLFHRFDTCEDIDPDCEHMLDNRVVLGYLDDVEAINADLSADHVGE